MNPRIVQCTFSAANEDEWIIVHRYDIDFDDRRQVREFVADADAWLTRGGKVETLRLLTPPGYICRGPQPWPQERSDA